MSEFTDTTRQAFEAYLMGNKEEAISMLIPGSFYHFYLTLIDALKKGDLSEETQKKFEEFRLNLGDKNGAERLILQNLFLRIEQAKTAEERN